MGERGPAADVRARAVARPHASLPGQLGLRPASASVRAAPAAIRMRTGRLVAPRGEAAEPEPWNRTLSNGSSPPAPSRSSAPSTPTRSAAACSGTSSSADSRAPLHAIGGIPAEPLAGVRYCAALAEVEGDIDLAVIAATAAELPGVVRACAARGVGGAVLAVGASGATPPLEADETATRALLADAARGGLRLVGPNSIGMTRPGARLDATFTTGGVIPGSLGLVSQSGAICATALDWAAANRIRVLERGVARGRARRRLRRGARVPRPRPGDEERPAVRRDGPLRARVPERAAARSAHQAGRGGEGRPARGGRRRAVRRRVRRRPRPDRCGARPVDRAHVRGGPAPRDPPQGERGTGSRS